MIWLHRFMEGLGKKQENIRLFYDNESAIHLAKNSTFHSKTKHIQLRYHFIRFTLEDGKFVGSQFNFFNCPKSCLHLCLLNFKFLSHFANIRHFYFMRHLQIGFDLFFHDWKRENSSIVIWTVIVFYLYSDWYLPVVYYHVAEMIFQTMSICLLLLWLCNLIFFLFNW